MDRTSMQLFYRCAADSVVILHAGYVLFVVLGFTFVLLGILFKWQWTRNFWFRMLHLVAIGVVVAEEWSGIVCPLTVWEKQLRQLAGQTSYRGDFVANLVHDVLFVDWPPWMFRVAYTIFGVTVLLTFLLAPPRWPKRRPAGN